MYACSYASRGQRTTASLIDLDLRGERRRKGLVEEVEREDGTFTRTHANPPLPVGRKSTIGTTTGYSPVRQTAPTTVFFRCVLFHSNPLSLSLFFEALLPPDRQSVPLLHTLGRPVYN